MAIKTVLFAGAAVALSSAVLADAVVPGEFTDPTNVRKLTDDQQGWWYVAPDHLKYPYISTSYASSGSRSLYFYGTSSYYSYAALPRLSDAVTLDSLEVSVSLHATTSGYSIEAGMMTDPRDGHEYKTVSFEFHGKKYEWMAEDLKYKKRSAGVYSWTEAMQLNKSYMSERVPEGLIDSLHQGICPEGWHISNVRDWEELMLYVGGFKNLLDESWRTDKKTAEENGLGGVFYNRFDFNLEPMDKKFLELYYHTYVHESNTRNVMAERDSLWNYYVENDSVLIDWVYLYLNNYGVNRNLDNTTLEISTRFSSFTPGPREKGRVRCVKD